MGSRLIVLRWPARAFTMTLQSSPIVLTLVIAVAIAHASCLLDGRGAGGSHRRTWPGQRQQCRPGDRRGDVEPAGRRRARRRPVRPSAQPIGDPDRGVPGECLQGTPIASFIGAPELLSSLTDITSFSSGRATTYTILLVFYTSVVMVVVWLCGKFQRYLERRQAPA